MSNEGTLMTMLCGMLKTVFLCLALSTVAVNGLSCLSCNYTNVAGDVSGDATCVTDPQVTSAVEGCDECVTLAGDLTAASGVVRYQAVYRGCRNNNVMDMTSLALGCTDESQWLQTFAASHITVGVSVTYSQACVCNTDNCNVDEVTMTLPEPEPVDDAPQDVMSCHSCVYASTKTHTEGEQSCMDQAGDSNQQSCQSGEVCAAAFVDVATITTGDIDGAARVVARGCVSPHQVSEEQSDYCGSAAAHGEAVAQLIQTDQPTGEVSGAVCSCSQHGCNTMGADEMIQEVYPCITSCSGMATGSYNKCGRNCKKYIRCLSNGKRKNSKCPKKSPKFDASTGNCAKASKTCPSGNSNNRRRNRQKHAIM